MTEEKTKSIKKNKILDDRTRSGDMSHFGNCMFNN